MRDIKATCKTCGTEFVISEEEQNKFAQLGFSLPSHCKACRIARKNEKRAQENAQRAEEYRKAEQKRIDKILANPPILVINRANVTGTSTTLYLIGNGFDILHGAKSSYYAFRDTMGKHNLLRQQLETWNLDEDLWADFEESLAHMNDSAMLNNAPDMMDVYGVLDEDDDDFSTADFFAAAEFAVQPLVDISYELPRKFRQWVKTLKPGSEYIAGEKALPMQSVIVRNAIFLNFNYTEFLETLYGVERKNINYIHGMRKLPNSDLILGHSFGAEDDYEQKYKTPKFRNQTDYNFYEVATQRVSDYYSATEKKSDEIIRKNANFFENLKTVERIITIGHSLSKVDYPYLQKIVEMTNEPEWYVGWYSSADYERIIAFAQHFNIHKIKTFR